MWERTPIDYFLSILKFIISVVSVGFLLYCSYLLIDTWWYEANSTGESYCGGWGMGYALTILFLGLIYTVLFIIAIVGLLIATMHRDCKENKKLTRHFVVLVFLPIVCELAYVLLGIILGNIG